MKRWIVSALAALALALPTIGSPALAQPAMTATEEASLQLVDRAYETFSRTGYAGIQPLLPELRAALDNAPASRPAIEIGDDYIIVRASSQAQGTVLMMLATTAAPDDGNTRSVAIYPSIYPAIALLLASDAVEHARYEEALGYTSRGLAIQSDDPGLILEHSIALMALDRDAEALEMIDEAIGSGNILFSDYRAPLLRRRGALLIELRRFPEARAAFEQSLEIEPNHPGALHELQVIENAEHGGEVGNFEVVTAAEAAGED